MANKYSMEMTPEVGQEYLASRLREIGLEGRQAAGQATAGAMARGLGGQAAYGSQMGQVQEGISAQREKTLGDYAYNVAGLQRQERLTDEERAYQSSEKEKDRAMQEKLAQMGYAWQSGEGEAQRGYGKVQGQQGAVVGALTGLASMGLGAGIFSDIALKKDIREIGRVGSLGVYAFRYKSDEHPELGLPEGKQIGVMAQEVERIYPKAVSIRHGFKMVDYAYLAGVL